MAEIGDRRPMRGRVALLLTLLLAAPLLAQDDAPPERPGIPVVGRPANHFYNAAGTGIKLNLEASPTELATNEWLQCTLSITHLLNAAAVEKPSLKSMPEFAAFQIDETKELDPGVDPERHDRRVFVYRLRPSSTAIVLVPEIAFYYFDPKRIVLPNRPQDRFPRAVSNAVPIRVHEPLTPPPAGPIPLRVPTFCEQSPTANQMLNESLDSRGWRIEWPAMLIVSPLLALGYVLIWRWRNPDAAKQRHLKRSRAVRVALVNLARVRDAEGFAERIDRVLLRYLHERFDLPPHFATPADVSSHLRSVHASWQAADQLEACLKQCDAIRFGAADVRESVLRAEAERSILALEEDA